MSDFDDGREVRRHVSLEKTNEPLMTGIDARRDLFYCLSMSAISCVARDQFLVNAYVAETPYQVAMIGQGQCCKVWRGARGKLVGKIPNDEAHVAELRNAEQCHIRVQAAFETKPRDLCQVVSVPELIGWQDPIGLQWNCAFQKQFPGGKKGQPRCILVEEAIKSVGVVARDALLRHFFKDRPKIMASRGEILRASRNRDVLLRIYLGQLEPKERDHIVEPEQVMLADFPLAYNDLTNLELMKDQGRLAWQFAIQMAEALALLHWRVGLDAKGVEFVLGTGGIPEGEEDIIREDESFDPLCDLGKGDTFKAERLWMFDFGKCNEFVRSNAGLLQLVEAFWSSGPYLPRPDLDYAGIVFENPWTTFSAKYLEVSKELTKSRIPQMFIASLEAEGRDRRLGVKISSRSAALPAVASHTTQTPAWPSL